MTSPTNGTPLRFVRHNPLVPAVALFLVGLTLSRELNFPALPSLAIASLAWLLWTAAEQFHRHHAARSIAHAALALACLCTGAAVYTLNQYHVEPAHLARFLEEGQLPVTLRARIVMPPDTNPGHHGNEYFLADATELLTRRGWINATGLFQAKWGAGITAPNLQRGDHVQIFGWLQRPPPALNPGGRDVRAELAADRIFALVRIPRQNGLQLLHRTGISPEPLTRFRRYLREKLLAHTANLDPDAANAMVALLLGYRDPSIGDISRSFADAGVAHLLAISGAHIVFLAAVILLLLKFLPLRPRWREGLTAVLIAAYILATPCGPPVVRAGIVLALVLIARLLGRPRTYMNLLAAAIAVILIWRPADIVSAGFQLTFVCTAALILLGERVHHALFSARLERAKLIADLADTPAARLSFTTKRMLASLLTANLIGALTAAPLVAWHFNQLNPLGIVTGILAFPLVACTMIAALLQLALELLAAPLALYFAPLSTGIAHLTIRLIEALAALPGAAIPLRSPPPLLLILLYATLLLWIARRVLRITRAFAINMVAFSLLLLTGWYTLTQPVGALQLQVLSVGQGSSILLRTPAGDSWVINAGSRDAPNLLESTLRPALRQQATRHLTGLLVTALDTPHASAAAQLVNAFNPATVLLSTGEEQQDVTLSSMLLEDAIAQRGASLAHLSPGDDILLGKNAHAQVLWLGDPHSRGMLLSMTFAHRQLLLLDPAALPALALSPAPIHPDAAIILAPERGHADDDLRNTLHHLGIQTILWSGRTPWAAPNHDWNAADGAIALSITQDGALRLTRLP